MRKIIFIIFLLAFFVLSPCLTYADENPFTTQYDVTYTIMENGVTHASFVISLINKTSDSYASSYKIRVGFADIQNVQASDPEGILSPILEKTKDGNEISVDFKKRVVGVGNTLTFDITFDTQDVVQKQGSVWEANIPGIENQNDFSRFDVHVKTPPSLGGPTYIKPSQNSTSLNFTKGQLKKGGIAIGFGNAQLYRFDLAYHLKNTHVFPIKTELALPSSTNYQEIAIDEISPKPLNVRIDEDGNWLAQYSLSPSQRIDVKVRGKAKLFLIPKKQIESEERLALYLKEQQYWETSDKNIKSLANTLKTPYAIYQYVVNTLTYDYDRVTQKKPRLGAVMSLKNKNSAVCLEFTDLFIAIARAAGIPAREINGFAYTENSTQRPLSMVEDILHSWPEYYDKELQTWIMIDPTWGNTTNGTDYFSLLDFDHFTFVRKGINSQYPVPAGGYKSSETTKGKDVNISFIDFVENNNPAVTVIALLPNISISGFPITGTLLIKNVGATFFPSQNVKLSSKIISPSQDTLNLEAIPPFGYKRIPVAFKATSFLTNADDTIKISLQNSETTHSIKIIPIYLTVWGLYGGILIASIAICIFYITRRFRRIHLLKQQEESALRGKGQKP